VTATLSTTNMTPIVVCRCIYHHIISLALITRWDLRLYLRSDTVHASVTRANNFKLVPQHFRYDLRKYYFTNRLVPVANCLSIDVVLADNINVFKQRL